ncbi:TonB-dependent receptor [Marinilabilia salmonicolor]|uniref:TonB-dependent receptor n=1 Tax=Marinilabilia salmonicolor TaxID=989 RepID=UPI0002D2F75F|nr:TonB-dependent receptor [Marinilabilia salmonicolor]
MLVLLAYSASSYGQFFGRIVDAQTGQPVEGAKLLKDKSTLAVSSHSGHFSFSGDASMQVTVSHPDYKTMQESIEPDRELFFLLIPSELKIDEITISAPLLNYRNKEVPAGFSLITADSIHPSLSAIEVLERSPGIVMQKGALNTGRVMIRGIGSRSPYATTRVRAYLDDIPLTSGDGNTTIEDLEMQNIARTEIVRGPSSALYGSGLGGVIIFHPDHTQSHPLTTEALMQYGPFGQTKTLLNAGFRHNKSVVKTNVAHTQTDGFRQNSNYERWNGQLLFRHHFGNHALFFLSNYTHLNAQIPSSLDEPTYQKTPDKAATNWLAVKGSEQYDKWLSGVTLKSDLTNKITNKAALFLNHINAFESRPFNILDDQMLTYGLRNELSINLSMLNIIGGAEIFNERYDWQLMETNNGVPGSKFSDNHETRFFANFFAKGDIDLSEKWRLSAGANLNFLSFELEDNFNDQQDLSGSYQYDPVLSPRIGITGTINPKMTMYASAGHGFSPPSVEETLLPEGNINPDLQPEEGWNYDLGVRGNLFNNHLYFDITGYFVSLKNLLVTKRETEEIFYGINAGTTSHYGLESAFKLKMFNSSGVWSGSLNLNHTWMKNRFENFIDNDEDYSGNQLPGIPDQHLQTIANLGFKNKTFLQFIWRYSGKMYLDDANIKTYSGHHIFDVSLSKRIQTGGNTALNIQGGINNIFDRHYAGMVLVNAPSFGNNLPRYYYPGAPANGYIRIIFRFTKQ